MLLPFRLEGRALIMAVCKRTNRSRIDLGLRGCRALLLPLMLLHIVFGLTWDAVLLSGLPRGPNF